MRIFNKTLSISCMLALVCLMICHAAHAMTLSYVDFENHSIASHIIKNNDGTETIWGYKAGGGAECQIAEFNGNKVFKINSSSDSSILHYDLHSAWTEGSSPITRSEVWYYAIDFYLDNLDNGDNIYVQIMGNNWLPLKFTKTENETDGQVLAGGIPVNTNTIIGTPTFSFGNWHKLIFKLDYANDAYEISLDGEVLSHSNDTVKLSSVLPKSITNIRNSFISGGTSQNKDIYFDSVILTKAPIIGNVVLDKENPAVGDELNAKFECFTNDVANAGITWYISDDDSSYSVLDDTNTSTITVTGDYKGRYIKAGISAENSYGYSSPVIFSHPVYVPDDFKALSITEPEQAALDEIEVEFNSVLNEQSIDLSKIKVNGSVPSGYQMTGTKKIKLLFGDELDFDTEYSVEIEDNAVLDDSGRSIVAASLTFTTVKEKFQVNDVLIKDDANKVIPDLKLKVNRIDYSISNMTENDEYVLVQLQKNGHTVIKKYITLEVSAQVSLSDIVFAQSADDIFDISVYQDGKRVSNTYTIGGGI